MRLSSDEGCIGTCDGGRSGGDDDDVDDDDVIVIVVVTILWLLLPYYFGCTHILLISISIIVIHIIPAITIVNMLSQYPSIPLVLHAAFLIVVVATAAAVAGVVVVKNVLAFIFCL